MGQEESGGPLLPTRILKSRLSEWLSLFASLTNGKSIYQHALLYLYYQSLMSHSDPAVVRMALQCLQKYKEEAINQYRENMLRLVDDHTFRSELLTLHISSASREGKDSYPTSNSGPTGDADEEEDAGITMVAPEHRRVAISMITRIVLGKFASRNRSSRNAKADLQARRAAAMSFLAALGDSDASAGRGSPQAAPEADTEVEMGYLLALVLRSCVPRRKLLALASDMSRRHPGHCGDNNGYKEAVSSQAWNEAVLGLVRNLTPADFAAPSAASDTTTESSTPTVTLEVQVAWLYSLEELIKTLGFRVPPSYVSMLLRVTSLMLEGAQWSVSQILKTKENDSGDNDNNDYDGDEDDKEEEEEEIEGDSAFTISEDKARSRISTNALKIRTLALTRLSEFVGQYYRTISHLTTLSDTPGGLVECILRPLPPLLKALPASISGSARPPALLKLLAALVGHSEILTHLSPPSDDSLSEGSQKSESPTAPLGDLVISTLIACISARNSKDSGEMVVRAISAILSTHPGALRTHMGLIIDAFSARFTSTKLLVSAGSGGKEDDDNEANIVSIAGRSPNIQLELQLLCAITRNMFGEGDVHTSGNMSEEGDHASTTLTLPTLVSAPHVSKLASVLLSMLQTYMST